MANCMEKNESLANGFVAPVVVNLPGVRRPMSLLLCRGCAAAFHQFARDQQVHKRPVGMLDSFP